MTAVLHDDASPDASGPQILEVLCKMADVFAIAAKGDVEIVVHDLKKKRGSIVKIVNGHISDRREGDPLAPSPIENTRFREAFGDTGEPGEVRVIDKRVPWITNERPVRSRSLMFFDSAGKACAMICVNFDETLSERLRDDFALMFGVARPPLDEQPSPRDENMGAMVESIVDEAIAASPAPVARMSKQEKLKAVEVMHKKGVFLMRGSVEYVAKRLEVTKHTIYNYFDVLGISR